MRTRARAPAAARDVVALLDGPAGAYVHVPFCEWICPFCPYNKVRARDDLAGRYFAALQAEVDALREAYLDRFGEPFTSLYVGGGTPTLYPDALGELLERVPTIGERAVEVLPNHGTPQRLDALAAMGFTAVSIGAQSFHDPVLQHLGRPHDAQTARRAMQAAVGRFGLVDVDLIVDTSLGTHGDRTAGTGTGTGTGAGEAKAADGARAGQADGGTTGRDDPSGALPGAFLADVEACFGAGVDQVSTYPLMRFGYTPFGRARHQRRLEHEVLAAVDALARASGYERRSVWTFNGRGSAPYTSITRRRFLGMGAGATSVTGQDFLVNHFGLAAYCDDAEAGRLPLARHLRLGRWAGGAYDAFWQAYAGGVSPALLTESYGRAVGTAATVALAPARAAGLVRRTPQGYPLTPRGFDRYHDLERAVTYEFIEPLWAEMLREHSAEGGMPTPDACVGADWASPDRARRGHGWAAVRRLASRPVA